MAHKRRGRHNQPHPTSIKALAAELSKATKLRVVTPTPGGPEGAIARCGKCGQEARLFRRRAAADSFVGLDEVESRRQYDACQDLTARTVHLVPKAP